MSMLFSWISFSDIFELVLTSTTKSNILSDYYISKINIIIVLYLFINLHDLSQTALRDFFLYPLSLHLIY